MATLTIRNLPDEVRDRLRVRAAEKGRSMEAEARAVLGEAMKPLNGDRKAETEKRWHRIEEIMKPYLRDREGLVDEFLAERRRMWGEE